MLRLLADENFNRRIVRGVLRRLPEADILRVQDVGLGEVDDPEILAWAAAQNRVLLSHDVATIISFAYDRVRAGLPMPGVCIIPSTADIGRAVEDLLLVIQASDERDWEGQVRRVVE